MPSPTAVPGKRAFMLKLAAWLAWAVSMLWACGEAAFAVAVRADVYFVRYYQHHAMNGLTAFSANYFYVYALWPLLWLPVIVAYQRQAGPKLRFLLALCVTLAVAALATAIVILSAGPPIQM